MIFNSKSKKCCWGIVSENVVELFRNLCFWVVFSINSLDFPSHTVKLIGCFCLAQGILIQVVSAWVMKGPLLHLSLIFSQNLTPAHLSIHKHIIMHTLSLSVFRQNNQRPKWLTLKIGWNDPPTKSETTHPLNLDETTQGKSTQDQNDPHSAVSHNLIPNKFLSMKLFPSFTEPVFVSYNFCLLRCRFVIWISWVKNLEPLVNGPAPLFPKR